MAVPERTCRVCRTKRPKSELVRWVMRPEGLVKDLTNRMDGRGFYSCRGQHEEQIAHSLKKGRK